MESTALFDDNPVWRATLDDARSVGTALACQLIGCSRRTLQKLIDRGEIESFVDGNRRKVTLRSILRRRDRLLAEGGPSPSQPHRRKLETASP